MLFLYKHLFLGGLNPGLRRIAAGLARQQPQPLPLPSPGSSIPLLPRLCTCCVCSVLLCVLCSVLCARCVPYTQHGGRDRRRRLPRQPLGRARRGHRRSRSRSRERPRWIAQVSASGTLRTLLRVQPPFLSFILTNLINGVLRPYLRGM